MQGNELRIEVKSDKVLLLKASHAPSAFVSAIDVVSRLKTLQQLDLQHIDSPSPAITKS